MSNVLLTIGGRKFTVACADGEEERIGHLGRMVDSRVDTLGDTAGQNEVRMLLYAALVLADELDETKANPPAASNSTPTVSAEISGRLEGIAGKLENLADHLEQSRSNT